MEKNNKNSVFQETHVKRCISSSESHWQLSCFHGDNFSPHRIGL